MLKLLSKEFNLLMICLTLGDQGACVFFENTIYHHNGYKVEVVDTVGAGDAFLATFLASYLKGQNIQEMLNNSCKIGAFVTSQKGANPNYPTDLLV